MVIGNFIRLVWKDINLGARAIKQVRGLQNHIKRAGMQENFWESLW